MRPAQCSLRAAAWLCPGAAASWTSLLRASPARTALPHHLRQASPHCLLAVSQALFNPDVLARYIAKHVTAACSTFRFWPFRRTGIWISAPSGGSGVLPASVRPAHLQPVSPTSRAGHQPKGAFPQPVPGHADPAQPLTGPRAEQPRCARSAAAAARLRRGPSKRHPLAAAQLNVYAELFPGGRLTANAAGRQLEPAAERWGQQAASCGGGVRSRQRCKRRRSSPAAAQC